MCKYNINYIYLRNFIYKTYHDVCTLPVSTDHKAFTSISPITINKLLAYLLE